MLTPASVALMGPNKAELTRDGKTLTLQVDEPATATLKTWPTDPTHDYDTPNPGTVLVGFEITYPTATKTAITVSLTPASSAKQAKPMVLPLAQWPR